MSRNVICERVFEPRPQFLRRACGHFTYLQSSGVRSRTRSERDANPPPMHAS